MNASKTLPELRMLIDGNWIDADERAKLPVENPATKQIIGYVPIATEQDIDNAITAADRAFQTWRRTSPYERAAIIHRAAQLLRERADDVAVLMTLENGKTRKESHDEVYGTPDIMDSMATNAAHLFGKVLPGGVNDGRTIQLNEPIGPIAAFTTWNYPLTVPARKISAALAAGCTVVIKPAEETPASALALAEAFVDAGLPHGVLNVLFGDPAMISSRLIASPVIRKVSFTGSEAVGKHLASLAGAEAKPALLELGGHAPVIIFEDADIKEVAKQAVGAKIHNNGQSCGSPTRFFVQDSVYDDFVAEFSRLADEVVVADGLTDGVAMGPLANERRYAAMKPFIDDAVAKGAKITAGGTGDDTNGYFFRPTVLSDVPEDAEIMLVEPFGPIAVVTPFSTEEEVIRCANDVEQGLGAYLWTSSADRVLRIPPQLDFSMVSVNRFGIGGRDTFFGGRKSTGFGSEGGPESLEEFLIPKLIQQA